MTLDPRLLEILVCPECKEDLVHVEIDDKLLCRKCRLVYRIEDEIPVMLVDEAETLTDEEVARLESRARESHPD